jgi:tetratricopeptide (TPR) repeat protein
LAVGLATFLLIWFYEEVIGPQFAEDVVADNEDPDADAEDASLDAEEGGLAVEEEGPAMDFWRSGQADVSGLREKVQPSLVTIEREDGRGTGFVIENGLVVTAYHVVPDGRKSTVIFQDGERAEVAGYFAYDPRHDVAVLRSNSKRTRKPLGLAPSLPAAGEPVASFRPGGGELLGKVMDAGNAEPRKFVAGRDFLRTTLNAVPGWSGSPVVNMQGQVVGVVSCAEGAHFKAAWIHFIGTGTGIVPVTTLRALLGFRYLDEAIQLDPGNAQRYHERANLHFHNGDLEEALADYTEAIRLKPDSAETYHDRGRTYARKGNLNKAVVDYTQAVELDREFIEAYRSRAKAYAARNDYDKAIADFTTVIQREAYDSRAFAGRGAVYAQMGQKDKAVADYHEAIRLKPMEAEMWQLRGAVCAAKGEHDKAISHLTKAIQLDARSVEAYCLRGAVHGARRDFHKAVADFTAAIRLDPTLTKLYHNRAAAYAEMGYKDSARLDRERAGEVGPGQE